MWPEVPYGGDGRLLADVIVGQTRAGTVDTVIPVMRLRCSGGGTNRTGHWVHLVISSQLTLVTDFTGQSVTLISEDNCLEAALSSVFRLQVSHYPTCSPPSARTSPWSFLSGSEGWWITMVHSVSAAPLKRLPRPRSSRIVLCQPRPCFPAWRKHARSLSSFS